MSAEQRVAVPDLLQCGFDTMFDALDGETERQRLIDAIRTLSP